MHIAPQLQSGSTCYAHVVVRALLEAWSRVGILLPSYNALLKAVLTKFPDNAGRDPQQILDYFRDPETCKEETEGPDFYDFQRLPPLILGMHRHLDASVLDNMDGLMMAFRTTSKRFDEFVNRKEMKDFAAMDDDSLMITHAVAVDIAKSTPERIVAVNSWGVGVHHGDHGGLIFENPLKLFTDVVYYSLRVDAGHKKAELRTRLFHNRRKAPKSRPLDITELYRSPLIEDLLSTNHKDRMVVKGEYGGKPVAVKTFPLTRENSDLQFVFDHPHIMTVYGHCYERKLSEKDKADFPYCRLGYVHLVMELASHALADEKDPVQREAAVFQTLLALEHLHSLGITHRDVKPDNIFYVSYGHGKGAWKLGDFGSAWKLGDFGIALNRGDTTGLIRGTINWTASEACGTDGQIKKGVDPLADVYSIAQLISPVYQSSPNTTVPKWSGVESLKSIFSDELLTLMRGVGEGDSWRMRPPVGFLIAWILIHDDLKKHVKLVARTGTSEFTNCEPTAVQTDGHQRGCCRLARVLRSMNPTQHSSLVTYVVEALTKATRICEGLGHVACVADAIDAALSQDCIASVSSHRDHVQALLPKLVASPHATNNDIIRLCEIAQKHVAAAHSAHAAILGALKDFATCPPMGPLDTEVNDAIAALQAHGAPSLKKIRSVLLGRSEDCSDFCALPKAYGLYEIEPLELSSDAPQHPLDASGLLTIICVLDSRSVREASALEACRSVKDHLSRHPQGVSMKLCVVMTNAPPTITDELQQHMERTISHLQHSMGKPSFINAPPHFVVNRHPELLADEYKCDQSTIDKVMERNLDALLKLHDWAVGPLV